MKSKPLFIFVLSLVILSLGCNIVTGSIPASETTATGQPIVPKGKGPAGLTAEATSADSVLLTWQPVSDATSYNISVSIEGGNAFPVMDISSSSTSYEDFLALPGSHLKYAVEALSDSGSIGQSVIEVTTPERQPNPLTVDAKLDSSKTASATIGIEGGSITLQDAKGVGYTLDILAGALDIPTDITLTSVKNIGGWPLDGDMLGAVKLEPEGLVLNEMASLSITIPEGTPSNGMYDLGFAFSGKGNEFHLKPVFNQVAKTGYLPGISGYGHLSSPVKQNGAAIVLETLVMYGVGIGQGTAENAVELAKYHAPADSNSAMDQKEAAAQFVPDANVLKRLGDLEDVNTYAYAYNVYTSMILTTNCTQLTKAVQNMESFIVRSNGAITRGAQRPDLIKEEQLILWGNLTDKIKEVVDHATDDCKKEPQDKTWATDGVGCLDSLLVKIAEGPSPFYQDLQNKLTTKFGNSTVKDWKSALDKCLPAYQASGGTGYTFSGAPICKLNEPFSLNADGMEHFKVDFTPTSPFSGTMKAAGTASDGGITCTDGGAGYYTIIISPDGSGKVTVTIPPSKLTCPGRTITNKVIQVFNISQLNEKPAICK